MDAIIEIGRCITMGTCTILVFVFLALLSTVKFGLIFKIAKPIFGFLIGLCIGAYLLNLISEDAARVGAIFFGIGGALASFAIGSSSQKV